jgi:hypothetical protein
MRGIDLELLAGTNIYLRQPTYNELSYIKRLWECEETNKYTGGTVIYDDIALENIPGQQALLKFGFEHDPSVQDVFLVKLTKEGFLHLQHAQR